MAKKNLGKLLLKNLPTIILAVLVSFALLYIMYPNIFRELMGRKEHFVEVDMSKLSAAEQAAEKELERKIATLYKQLKG